MQTFLPYKRFDHSARVLDDRRLGKQRVETMQIMHANVRLQALHFEPQKGGIIPWVNHPATKMWRGHEAALLRYQQAMCNEWARRGFNDTCLEKTTRYFEALAESIPDLSQANPWWVGLRKIHSVHRANLLRKDPEWYGKFKWTEEPAEGYWWPVS